MGRDHRLVLLLLSYFFFLPFPPPPLFTLWLDPLAVAGPLSIVLPWVAPAPPPLRFLFPCPNEDLSLFFSQRSGSGAGVTPGTTPLGTRDFRTVLSRCAGSSPPAAPDDDAASAVATDDTGCEGGGFVSMFAVSDAGSASRARRKSVLMKSRCF